MDNAGGGWGFPHIRLCLAVWENHMIHVRAFGGGCWGRGGWGSNLQLVELQSCIVSTSQAPINCGILTWRHPGFSTHLQLRTNRFLPPPTPCPSAMGKRGQPLLSSESHAAVKQTLTVVFCSSLTASSIRRHLLICSVYPLNTDVALTGRSLNKTVRQQRQRHWASEASGGEKTRRSASQEGKDHTEVLSAV